MDDATKKLDAIAIENLRTYLRIPSVHPNINYEPCINFLKKQAEEIGLTFNVYRPIKEFPHAVLTWKGKEPDLQSVILNSHMDVVPVFENEWSHKPFDADIDENGNIFARGVQDTKALGIQYLEAIKRLKQSGHQPKRTVHVTFVSDEESGGVHGAKVFVKTTEFKALNAAFALDEGSASENDTAIACYGEKRSWKFAVHCTGPPGHGSLLLDDTAGEKVQYILNKFYEFRAQQKKLSDERNSSDDTATVNLTMITGGVQANVIPPKFTITFDARVPVEKFNTFEAQVNKWCKEAGSGITIEDQVKDDESPNTPIDGTNPFWIAFKTAVESMGIKLQTKIFEANSDGRFLRAVGVPTIGYSPSLNTPSRPHQHNEFLNVNEFLKGIRTFEKIIPALTNV